jgi:hypothetical protein
MRNKTLLHSLPAYLFLLTPLISTAQQEPKTLQVFYTSETITIDGLDNEDAWSASPATDYFINKWPLDTGRAKLQTEIKVVYNDKFLYLFAKMYVNKKNLVIQSLKRDVNPYYSEGISVVLDPNDQKSSGFTFGVNAGDAQFDGIVQLNSDSFDWDSKWYSATKRYPGYWTAEIAIPFKSLRFPSNKKVWGINFIRNDMANNSFSTWNRVPLEYFGANLGYLGKAIFNNAPHTPANNNSFIPYVKEEIFHDSGGASSHLHAGIDAKIAVTSSLNLAATINPDFSQVDVDQQVINLDRYDILLPEKRLFFLENSDLYTNLGSVNVRPYFSRRIGLTEDGQAIPLIVGARLNGYLNPKTRIEVMDIQSAKQQNSFYQNYYTTVIERQVLKRSNIRGYFTDVESFGDSAFKSSNISRFNRVAGIEFNYIAKKGNCDLGAKLSGSFNPVHYDKTLFENFYLDYFSPHVLFSTQFNNVGQNYIASLGFTPRLYNFDAATNTTVRLGYYENSTHLEYDFYPKNKKLINMHVLEANPAIFCNDDGSLNEADLGLKYTILFSDRRTFYAGWIQKTIHLPFETSIFSGLDHFKPGPYHFGYFQLDYESNFLKPFSWSLNTEIGEYFNGKRISATGAMKLRVQPWGNFGISVNYNHINVENKTVNPFIISPTIELAFSKDIFWTTFAQYNTNINNFDINSRFQWRFKPLSDLFLVYSTNYLTPQGTNQNYSITLKLDYWIN